MKDSLAAVIARSMMQKSSATSIPGGPATNAHDASRLDQMRRGLAPREVTKSSSLSDLMTKAAGPNAAAVRNAIKAVVGAGDSAAAQVGGHLLNDQQAKLFRRFLESPAGRKQAQAMDPDALKMFFKGRGVTPSQLHIGNGRTTTNAGELIAAKPGIPEGAAAPRQANGKVVEPEAPKATPEAPKATPEAAAGYDTAASPSAVTPGLFAKAKAKWGELSDATKTRAMIGGTAAGSGILGGVVGNSLGYDSGARDAIPAAWQGGLNSGFNAATSARDNAGFFNKLFGDGGLAQGRQYLGQLNSAQATDAVVSRILAGL